MDCRPAEWVEEFLGVQQRHPWTRPGAQDDKAAMRTPETTFATQPLVFAAINGLRRQLGDGDLGVAADRPEPAFDGFASGGRSGEGGGGGGGAAAAR